MEAKSTDKKNFQLTKNGLLLGEMIYENQLFLKAELMLSGSEKYKIEPVGFFETSISVKQNEVPISSLSLSWSGKIIMNFENEQEYILRLNNVFSNRYTVENKNKEELIQIESNFNWREFQYRYDIAYNLTDKQDTENILLLMLSLYSVNLFIATLSGANAGIM